MTVSPVALLSAYGLEKKEGGGGESASAVQLQFQGCFLMLRKLLLVSCCVVVWALLSVFQSDVFNVIC